MEKLTIIKYPHPILRYKSKPVEKINAEFKAIIPEMFELMYEAAGVGLAANQVGLPYQFFIMNISGDPEKKEDEFVFINPVIQKQSGREEEEEGCLSFPDIRAPVTRPAKITLEGISLDGKVQKFDWDGFLARAAQHEIDHLRGVSFIDRLNEVARLEIQEMLDDLQEEFETDQRLGMIASNDQLAAEIAELEKKW